jgi:predicted PurR-regulated permease PerM
LKKVLTARWPFFAQFALMTLTFYILFNVLVVSGVFLVPLIMSSFLAIALSPVVRWLVLKRVNRILSVSLVVLTSLVLLAGIFVLVFTQLSVLSESSGEFLLKFQDISNQLISSLALYFELSEQDIVFWKTELNVELAKGRGDLIGFTISGILGTLKTLFVVPVYIFMFLYYQPHLLAFIHRLFAKVGDTDVGEVLTATKGIIQSYIVGLFAEFSIVAVLNTLGLFILGMDYAILLGVTSAFLNIIPYLGGLVSMIIFMVIALLTKPPIYVLYVLALYAVIQFIDNNYLVPRIVGSRVQLNAFVSLLVVVLGAVVWGIPGMFLSIPLLAIVKVLTDRMEAFRPVGFLLGEMNTEETQTK